MVGDEFAATMFMVDVEGHPEDLPLRLALEELDFFTTEVRILGVYPAADHRTARARTASATTEGPSATSPLGCRARVAALGCRLHQG